jgi:hypothetical protein
MNKSNNKVSSLIVVVIIMAIFNVIVFVIPFKRCGGFWTGYGFSMFYMLLATGVGFYIFDRPELKSKFYRIPLISIVWKYLVIQLIIGFIQMILDFTPIPFYYGLALNSILLGFCLIGLVTSKIAVDEIERIDTKIKEKVFFIKSLLAEVETLVNIPSEVPQKKILKDLAEAIKYSDPMSSPKLESIESRIEDKINSLSNAVRNNENDSIKSICNELTQLIAERNKKCLILK